MNAPLDPAVLAVLTNTPVGPLVGRPVNNILADMGFPSLPAFPPMPPMPELAPMPLLDISALARPLTDLAGSVGTGQFGADGAMDPTKILGDITNTLTSSIGSVTSAMSALDGLWSSAGSVAALGKSATAAADTAKVADQSVQTKGVAEMAAATVAQANAQLMAIIGQFIATAIATGPALVTPPGQAILLANATQALASAAAVIAAAKAELAGQTAEVSATGQKTSVTNAPNASSVKSVLSDLSKLGQIASPLSSMANKAMTPTPVKAIAKPVTKAASKATKGGGGGGGGGGGMGPAPRTLGQWQGHRMTTVAGAHTTTAAHTVSESVTSTRGVSPISSPMSPMGAGAGAAAAAGAGAVSHRAGDAEANKHHEGSGFTDDVVGEVKGAAVPVVGESNRPVAAVTSEPPDKALTL